jgi:RHH-type rel operon transcriptional repressor/antitoxin RelB
MTIQTAIQLPEDVFERLQSAANELGQSPSAFIRQAIEEHIEEVEHIRRAEETLDKVKSGEMRTYSLSEAARELGLDD